MESGYGKVEVLGYLLAGLMDGCRDCLAGDGRARVKVV